MISVKVNRRGKKITKPIMMFLTGLFFLLLALILHPYDYVFRDYIQNCSLRKHGIPFFNYLIDLIAVFGKGDLIAILIVIIAAKGLRKFALRITLAVLIMTVIVWCLKPTVHRERPNGRSNVSFPSGDSATASAFFASTAIEYPGATPLFVIAPAVAFVRVFNNNHYLSDVAAGLAIGIIAAGLSLYIKFRKLKILESIKPRFFLLAVFVMGLIIFIPDALRGRGLRFYFMEFFAPSLFVWMLVPYSRIFIFTAPKKENFILKIYYLKKRYCIACYDFLIKNFTKTSFEKLYFGIFTILPVFIIIISWIYIKNQGLLYSVSGLMFGMITTAYITKKHNKAHGNHRTAVYIIINSAGVLVFFFIISIIPVLFLHS